MSNIRAMDDVETRTVMTLRTGSKICVLVGLAFIVLSVYFLFVPITGVRTSSGGVFGCGTALSPAGGSFAHGVCGDVAAADRYRAYAALAVGLVTIVAGVLMFGVDRREEQRRLPRDHRDLESDDASSQRRDQDWHGDEPRTRRDRLAAERDDRTEPSRLRPGIRSQVPDPTRSARRQDDDHQPYNDGDDEQSNRRDTDIRYDDTDRDRYGLRAPGRNEPDEH